MNQQAITKRPDNALLWLDRGVMLRQSGREREALEAFEAAGRLEKEWAAPQIEMARTLVQLGRYGEASDLLTPLAAASKTKEIMYLLGVALVELGQCEKALAIMDDCLTDAPGHVAALVLKGRALLDLRGPSAADEVFEVARKLDPNDGAMRYWYCRSLFQRGDYMTALDLFGADALAHQFYHRMALFAAEGNTEGFKAWAADLVGLDNQNLEEALSGGVTEFVGSLAGKRTRDAALLANWRSLLLTTFGDNARFGRAINMLDVVVRFTEAGDEKILLELPLEERTLLRGGLKLSASKPR
jgi:tetratricopeptide (TPR) repeat protein